MDYEKERREAIEAGQRALQSLRAAQEQLHGARTWGIIDLMGGDLFSSFLKHSKLSNARTYIERAKYDLQVFNKELRDVSFYIDIDISEVLVFFDFMDSFLADLMVQSRISDAARRIDEAIYRVQQALSQL